MFRYLAKSLLLLVLTVVICCIIYPLLIWGIGQVFFPSQANGSLLKGPDGNIVGSKLIAQTLHQGRVFSAAPFGRVLRRFRVGGVNVRCFQLSAPEPGGYRAGSDC